MRRSNIFSLRSLVAVVAVLILGASAYGFAAANTVVNTGAGDGSGTVSGYAISDVSYALNTDATKVDSVHFVITPNAGLAQPSQVMVQVKSGGTWYTASPDTTTVGDTTDWTITTSGLLVNDITTIHVVATGAAS